MGLTCLRYGERRGEGERSCKKVVGRGVECGMVKILTGRSWWRFEGGQEREVDKDPTEEPW